MSGGDDVTIVWLADVPGAQAIGASAGEGAASEGARRALAEWARTRGLHLVPADAPSLRPLEAPEGLAQRVEQELYRAHESIAALDSDGTERSLARAEALLHAHPELPQAAWLRAEVERGWSARWLRAGPRDEARARAAWQNAEALDGGRAAGIGETSFPPRPGVPITIEVEGASSRTVVTLDGARLAMTASSGGRATYATTRGPGEHQLVATIDDRPVFASWVGVGEGHVTHMARAPEGRAGPASRIAIQVSDNRACAAAAFASVARDGTDVGIRATGVTCPRWVAAASTEGSGVLVARCAQSTCGPLLEWRIDRLSSIGPPQDLGPRVPWPAWATWTVLGFGAAAVTTVALVASGALETRPTEQRFVAGGVRVE